MRQPQPFSRRHVLVGGLSHRAGERFAMCSTFKTYAAAAVVRKSERGEIALSDTVTIEAAELNSAVPGDLRDTSTPGALGLGYRNLLAGEALGAAGRQQLTDWMRGNATSSMRAGLPAGWTSADKSGSGGYGTTNDVGIAYAPDGRRLLLSTMSRSATDDPAAPNQRPMIGELTAIAVGDLLQGK